MKQILFVCSFGKDRSRTGADLYKLTGYKTDFGGVHPLAYRQLTAAQLAWADLIVTFTRNHREKVEALAAWHNIGVEGKSVCLQIQNRYKHGDVDLDRRIIQEMRKVAPDLVHPVLPGEWGTP